MNIETREEALERVLALEKPKCPHCNQEMQIWEVPQITCGDGLGWGEPFLLSVLTTSARSSKGAGTS